MFEDGSGDLFGTTDPFWAGASGDGTVYEVKAGSGSITTLASFNGTNGEDPYAGVVEDSSGNLFGTTYLGGASNDGTVYEVKAGSGSITTLASFNGTNGEDPYAGVVEDSSGNLFGTTFEGGASAGYGTVYEMPTGSDSITTLASFSSYTIGADLTGGVVEDSSGDLFGTTQAGGATGDGIVYELSPTAQPPTFTADTPPAANVGTAYSYQFQATGAAPITFSATGLPGWAQLNPSSGISSGTPTAPGTFDFTVTASNGTHSQCHGERRLERPVRASSVHGRYAPDHNRW